jgi:predicted RNA-binding protein with RPS1 domain
MVRGIVGKITSLGAFVKVPGYQDGFLNFSRISESKSEPWMDEGAARRIVRENEAIYAKVVLVGINKYSLDIRFVDQEDGTDLDPDNGKRIEIEPEIANGVWYEVKAPKIANNEELAGKDKVELNKVYKGIIVRDQKYGVFVKLLDRTVEGQVGLLPQAKIGKAVDAKFGTKLFVKVVEVQKAGKFNCDARYVDQRTGDDLDVANIHSEEKLTYNGIPIPPDELRKVENSNGNQNEKRQDRPKGESRRRDRSDSPKRVERKRDRSDSPIARRREDKRRDRSDSPIARRREDKRRDRSDSPIARRREDKRRDRSDSPIARRREDRQRSDSPIPRNRDNKRRDRSESPIARKREEKRSDSPIARRRDTGPRDNVRRDRSESPIATRQGRRDRSESVVRRRRDDERDSKRSRDDIIIRRR